MASFERRLFSNDEPTVCRREIWGDSRCLQSSAVRAAKAAFHGDWEAKRRNYAFTMRIRWIILGTLLLNEDTFQPIYSFTYCKDPVLGHRSSVVP